MTLSHYYKCIRKTTSAFASIFNNIIFIKDDGQRLIVPIDFADKEKYLKRLQNDPDLTRKVQITLPRMSYKLLGFGYDKERKLNTNNKNFALNPDNSNTVFSQYNPVPYDFNFELTIYTRNVEDGNQIIEQILPYFTPDYSLRIDLIPEMNITKVVPVVLNYADQSIDSDGLYNTEVRTVIWTLRFNVKSYIFGAIKDAPIIKEVTENYYAGGSYPGAKGTYCHLTTKSLLMANTGCGNYVTNELVYQGQNLELAYGSGIVQEWNANTRILNLKDVKGDFKLNQPVIGVQTLTMIVPVALNTANNIAFTAVTTPVPNTANAISCWTESTVITEFNA